MSEALTKTPPPSISSAAGSRAKISATPATEPDSRALGLASGLSISGSFAHFDPAASSWKTSQLSLLEGLESYSEAWPRAGTMRSGIACRHKPSAPLTAGIGSSWSRGEYPTPSATPYGSSQNEGKVPHKRTTNGTPSLTTRAGKLWPTPRANAAMTTGLATDSNRARNTGRLEEAVGSMMWPTPTASDGRAKGTTGRAGRGQSGASLAGTARHWPTPTARDDDRRVRGRAAQGSGRREGTTLTDATCRTPGHQAQATCTHGGDCRWRLNPRFVEALMGFPAGWTDVD